VAKAIDGWKPPAALTGVDILPNVAALGVRNSVLQGAFMDPAYTPAFVKSLRAADGLRQSALPALLGSSLSAQVARPPVAPALNLPKFDALTTNIAAIGERVALISQAIQGPAQAMQRMVEQAQVTIGAWRPQFERFGEVMQQLAEEGRRLDEQTDMFVTRHGWPVPISLPSSAYRAIVSRHGLKKREVNTFMVESFRPRTHAYSIVREVLDESPDFGSRRPLLRQVYAAQRNHHWYLVINGLLPLVEGVLVDAVFPAGKKPVSKRIQAGVSRLVDDSPAYGEVGIRALETMIIGAGSGSALFEYYSPNDVERRSLNRHGVLHGGARRYGTEQNATKLFLLMVLLAECLAAYRTLGNKGSEQPALGSEDS
jgi:hypothetical protein